MILQFKVKNDRSIKEEQTLSFLSQSQESKSKGNYISTPFGDVLKSIAIYGANASGKSNILRALLKFREIVEKSANISPDEKFPFNPFKFSSEITPTEYEIIFLFEDNLYRYGFTYDDEKIIEEWLFCTKQETKRENEIFYRCLNGEQYDYKYGRGFSGEKKSLENRTRSNTLFLSKCASENHREMLKLTLFLMNFIRPIEIGDTIYFNDDIWDKKIQKKQEVFLKSMGIEFDELIIKRETNEIRNNLEREVFGEYLDLKSIPRYRPEYFIKRGNQIFFLAEESGGTRALLGISFSIISILERGGLLVVDELESSLHPQLVEQILKTFHDACNTKTQILFTTHNTSILKSSVFSKDQIYFTEKNDYATELYSLLEFKNVRSEENYEKKYLAGNYGALPSFENFNLMGN